MVESEGVCRLWREEARVRLVVAARKTRSKIIHHSAGPTTRCAIDLWPRRWAMRGYGDRFSATFVGEVHAWCQMYDPC